jgi:hypothetical protein
MTQRKKRKKKHTPGRDHDRKSAESKKKRFVKRQRQKREQREESLRQQWKIWKGLTDEQQKLRPDLEPEGPQPPDI